MDDAWRIKCGSPWLPPASSSPSPAQPSAAPQLLVPPPIVAASQVLPPASGNQMDVYSHQKCHPFISREANMENHSFTQDPVCFSSLNTGLCKTSKTEMGHSFLALLSEPSHPLASEFLLSKLGSSLSTSKVPACDIGNVATAVDFSVSAPYISTVSVHHGSNTAMTNASEHLSSYPMGRLPMISSSSQSTVSCNEFQVLGSQFPSSNAGRLILSQAHPDTERGLAVPSTSNINASQQKETNILTCPIRQVDASMNISSHASSFIRGCPRVFCWDKVGELFVSDNGLLGVFCLCHSFRMSVAKFCEHSGSHTVNPGDAVHLENGETVAQWRRLFFLNIGVRVPDDGSGWDWPDGTFMPGGLGRPTGNTLLKPNYAEAFQLQEPLSEVGRSDGLPGGHVSHFPYAETTALEKLLNRFQENAENSNTVEGVHIGSICSTSSIPVNEQSLKVVKENHSFMSPSILKHALATGQQNGVNKLIVHDPSVAGKAGNFSTLYPSPGPAKSFTSGTNSSRTHISSNSHLMDKDSTSKIELRLGQPSQQNHDCIMSNTAAMCSQQFSERFGLQKQQAHHSISQASVIPVAPDKTMQSLYHTPSQVSTSSGNLSRHSCGNLDAMHMSEQVVNAEADKNYLISLFLSHFSTSGKEAKPQVGDKLISKNENVVPSLIDHNCSSAKCSMIDFSRNVNNGIVAKSNMSVAGCSNQMEKRKGVRVSFEDEFYTRKNCSYLQDKQIGDLRVFAELSDGYSSHYIPSSDRQNSACFHQSFSRLLEEPAARHSNECGQMSFLVNRDTHDDAVLRCRNAGTGSLLPSLERNLSSSNPIYISGPPSPLSNKMNVNVTQNLVDEITGVPALNHVLKLSKPKHLPASLEMSDQGRQSCCSSAMGTTRKGSKENPIACDDLKHDQHCSGLQEASNIAFRSVHSCCNCCCGFAGNLTSKTCTAGSSRVCSQTGFVRDSKLYFKETHGKTPFCHLCNDDEQSVLRHFRTDSMVAGLAEYEVFNQKDGNGYIPGKCSCSAYMKSLKGCHYRGKGLSNSFKEHGACGKTHTIVPAYDLEHLAQDGKKISLGQFDGSRHVNISDNCQSAFGRDVPCRALVNSDSIIVQDRAETLPATGFIDYQLIENTAKDFDGTCEEIDSRKEQISGIFSACSAPVITEISTEVNNLDSYTGGTAICRSSFDPVIDEGSAIEKCGSSDDVLDNTRWDETVTVKHKVDFQKVSDYASCHTSKNETDETNHQSGEFIIEANVGKSFIPRKKRNQSHAECTVKECTLHREPIKRGWRAERKKKATKWRRLDDSFTASGLSLIHPDSNCEGYLELQGSSEGLKLPDHPQNTTEKACVSVTSDKFKGVKRKHCALSSVESLPWGIWDGHQRVGKDDAHIESADYDSSNRMCKSSTGKKVKNFFRTSEKEDSEEQENKPEVTEKILKGLPTCTKGLTVKKCFQERMVKPVVCDNLGIISIGSLSGKSKPVKIVSLSSVLKLAKRCNVNENEKEPGDTSELQMAYAGCFNSKGKTPEMSLTLREKDTGVGSLMPKSKSKTKPRGKETRKRRLSELTGNSEDTKDASCLPTSGMSECSKSTQAGFHLKESLVMGATDDLVGPQPQDKKGEMKPILKCSQQSHCRARKVPQQSQDYAVCQTSARKFPNKGRRCQLSLLDSDAFCCVCGSSNKDDSNYLLECNKCLIRVHQACYGISKVPKGHWSCRPCRINSKNIACVLCGYEGGAMTRAVRSRSIVQSLMKAWKEGRRYFPTRSAQAHTEDGARGLCPYSMVHNSITEGALDPTITQWVHVVCGLWTPGTRCPNVDTMSAFDVSGVLPATRRMVCSMCKRPGGSCIQCRVVGCSTHFHPWCAHQKGLLQSETEGVDNENVGFYGRCFLHATHHNCHSDGIHTDAGLESPGVKEFSCARSEGYKGRKKEHGLIHTFHSPSNNNGICSVPQEQLNAWLRINGQKSCARELLKPPSSEIDYDCRKEYARYKLMKGWKHLVVYKSRIHALGLYTSQFIPRGAMVVEYVGEIVGLRVADKREIEYQSGKRLQYKSACYFFRIDKEHIIDATRKGGIARFVNHSCLPNCVAKVISVKNEKKVVFFAERDINPGEEITYDYHFNHEEEGKKIPCFCNSRNCRLYLN